MAANSPWRAIGSLEQVVADLRREVATLAGGVYVIEFDSGVSKIGCSSNPGSRIASVARATEIYGGWKVLRVAVSEGCTNFYKVESALHRRFSESRVDGELFRASIEDVAAVLASIELLDETATQEASANRLINGVKAFWAQSRETCDAAEDEDLLERMSNLCLSMTVCSRTLALDIADSMNSEPSTDEKCAILERISKAVSDAILAELGPESAIVVLEHPDGRRELAMVQNPAVLTENDPRGRVVTIIKRNPAAPV